MKISLLDPGLKTPEGHHFDLDLRLVRALARRGHDVAVHGHANPDPGLVALAEEAGMRFHSTFRVSTYARLPQLPSRFEAYRTSELATAQDLAGVPITDMWFWPTLAPYQLAAAVHRSGAVRQIGGAWWLPRFPQPMGAPSWAATARKLAETDGSIIVGAYDELLCEGYRSFSPRLDIKRLPCPHDGTNNDRKPTSLRRIGFFGHQRAARGIDLIPELVDALLAKGFEVVVQDSSGRLKRKGNDARITVLEYIEDFPSELARCDAVIWPSHWEAYIQSLSGVVSECIATGVPVIVPSGCFPAQIAARYGCGVFFHEYSRAAILDAVDEAAREYSELAARARAAATAWHSQNGTDRLAAWIEEHSGAVI